MDETRQRLSQWLDEGRALSELVPPLFDDHARLRASAEAAEVECARLRQEVAALRAEVTALMHDRNEVADLIASGLSRLTNGVVKRLAGDPAEPDALVGADRRVRVLLVDDEPNFTGFVAEYLGDKGFDVLVASTGEEALAGVSHFRPHIVLLDMMMPGIGGLEALRRIKSLRPDMCVIVVTGLEDLETARSALASGAANYLVKPFTLDYLDSALALHMPAERAEAAVAEPEPEVACPPV
jgi:CheY-like chemotaxis protein